MADLSGIARGVNTEYAQVIVEDGDDEYIAWAKLPHPGLKKTDECWQVRKVYAKSATESHVLYADGDAEFDNACDDMPNLTYDDYDAA